MKKLIVLFNIVFCFAGGVCAQDDVFLEVAKDSITAAPVVNPNILCEDTCSHVHGIDLSHYQGNVFWEAVGDNTKMAYVYLKATEGGKLSLLPSADRPAETAAELYVAVSAPRAGLGADD